ncbi:MAG: rod shape-determining protein RodA [Nitrospirota bacterium]|nr:rod shape-determining protein RodA [Nitrospirota bacterium]
MVDRRLIENFDWGILLVSVALSLIGVMTIYSSTRPLLDSAQNPYFLRQLYWIILSLVAFIFVISIDYKWFIKFAYFFFAFGIVLLLIVAVAGKEGMGARRWIDIGFLSFQPSEFFKLFFVMALSRYLSSFEHPGNLGLGKLLNLTLVFFIVPAVFVLKQPDLGTALIILFIFLSMIMTAGVRKKIVLVTVILGLITLPFAGNFAWKGLKGYQKQRILTFIDPQSDPRGTGYHVTQSKVSIGSGGLLGKGFMKGTQGAYKFLPEKHTDFIFSTFAEEWGFFGSLVLFILYLFLIWRGLDTAKRARDLEGSFLALGVTYMFSFYFIINVGMTLGMIPVVGVPLPLLSYGGTALLSNFLAISLIENVRMRRFALYY